MGTQYVILSLLLGNPQFFLTASCGRKHLILFHFHHVKPVNVVFTCNNRNMSLPYGTNPESPRSVRDKTSMFHPKPCVAFRDKAKKKLNNKNTVEQQYKMRETIHWLF